MTAGSRPLDRPDLGPSSGLPRPSRREVVLGGVLAMIGAGSVLLRPRSTIPVLTSERMDAAVPMAVGPWRSEPTDSLVTAPADELAARLYDQILTRIYRAPSLPDVGLLIAYGRGQDTDVQLHRPDVCYPAQGFVLTDQRAVPVRLADRMLPAQVVTAQRYDRVEQIVFWTRIGQDFPPDVHAERGVIERENLSGRMPDAVLVRLSVDQPDRPAAVAAMLSFVRLLGAGLPADGRRLLLDGFAADRA